MEEAIKLGEVGFEPFVAMKGVPLFRKRKYAEKRAKSRKNMAKWPRCGSRSMTSSVNVHNDCVVAADTYIGLDGAIGELNFSLP